MILHSCKCKSCETTQMRYTTNLLKILAAQNNAQYKKEHLATGLAKQTIFSGLHAWDPNYFCDGRYAPHRTQQPRFSYWSMACQSANKSLCPWFKSFLGMGCACRPHLGCSRTDSSTGQTLSPFIIWPCTWKPCTQDQFRVQSMGIHVIPFQTWSCIAPLSKQMHVFWFALNIEVLKFLSKLTEQLMGIPNMFLGDFSLV